MLVVMEMGGAFTHQLSRDGKVLRGEVAACLLEKGVQSRPLPLLPGSTWRLTTGAWNRSPGQP